MCGCNSPSLQNTMLMTLIMHFRENVDDGMFHLLICSSELYQRLLVPNGTFICFFCFAGVYCFVWVVKSRVIQCAVFLVGFCYRLFISRELMFSASLFLLLSFCFFSFLLFFILWFRYGTQQWSVWGSCSAIHFIVLVTSCLSCCI